MCSLILSLCLSVLNVLCFSHSHASFLIHVISHLHMKPMTTHLILEMSHVTLRDCQDILIHTDITQLGMCCSFLCLSQVVDQNLCGQTCWFLTASLDATKVLVITLHIFVCTFKSFFFYHSRTALCLLRWSRSCIPRYHRRSCLLGRRTNRWN